MRQKYERDDSQTGRIADPDGKAEESGPYSRPGEAADPRVRTTGQAGGANQPTGIAVAPASGAIQPAVDEAKWTRGLSLLPDEAARQQRGPSPPLGAAVAPASGAIPSPREAARQARGPFPPASEAVLQANSPRREGDCALVTRGIAADKQGLRRELKKNRVLFLMLLPAIFYFLIFQYAPMTGIVVAFKHFRFDKGLFMSPWAGLDNFDFFFRSGKAWIVTRNTVLYNAAFIATGLIIQLAAALFIAEIGKKLIRKYVQSALLFPFFISWVVVGIFVYNLFNYEYGTINHYLKLFGLEPADVYGTKQAWTWIIIFFNNWKMLGYNSLIYLAAILAIDRSLYEAAEIDGATLLQRIRLITLPLLMPTLMIMLLLGVGQLFRGNFELFYNVVGNNAVLYNQTDVIDTFVFRSMITSSDIGMTAAAGFYQAVLCVIIIMLVNYTVKKVNPDYSLF